MSTKIWLGIVAGITAGAAIVYLSDTEKISGKIAEATSGKLDIPEDTRKTIGNLAIRILQFILPVQQKADPGAQSVW